MSETTVAWVGLGRMGVVMAGRLLAADTPLSVWNRTAAKCAPLVELGATQLHSVADAASSDVVFSMVLDDGALAALHDPATGLFSGPPAQRSVRVWIDGSTVSPVAAETAAAAAAAAGVAYVSAPISGNPGVVESGNAIFAVSGDPAALDTAEELCLRIGRLVHRVGSRAEANVVKLCTNALLAVTMQTIAEIAVLADKVGVSRAALMGFVNESAIGSPFSRYKTANMVELEFPTTFTAQGQRKDIRLALELARQAEVPMPVLSETEVAFSRLVGSGLGEGLDFATLVLNAARDAGHTLQPEELT
ncbi:MAG: NAD(P)-dependent oxidoreductase [Nocardioides sp.]|uniref:NAD(P)-dependent oxidoreductase n=1 Tax=Nocardioides sp. TaxID=35761 RepID=UPI0039E72B47